MLDASPAHCSTPGDTGKDLRREGLAESTSQAAYLGMTEKWRYLIASLVPTTSHPFVLPSRSSEGGVGLL